MREAKARGSLYYFTGKPCPRGHVALRWVSGANCVVCKRDWLNNLRRTDVKWNLLSTARARATKQGVPFSITPDDLTVPEVCPVFGMPLERNIGGNVPADNSPTIDRLDPLRGYVPGNVWVISWRANRMKSDATLDELEQLVAAVRERTLCPPTSSTSRLTGSSTN